MADILDDDFEDKITLAMCGNTCDHDLDGPPMQLTDDEGRVIGESATCSKCGVSAIDSSLMEDDDFERRKKFALSAIVPLM